jgi:prefoldin subunit 5
MKQKSRATRYSEAVSNIGMLRESFENMQTALNEVNETIEAVDSAASPVERVELIDARNEKISVAEKIIAENCGAFDDADLCTFEELRDELQNWLDNLPENLQSGSKADELNDAISNLDDVIQYVEDINSAGGDFSGASGFEAEAVETRIAALDTAIENCDSIEGTDVDFPRMFG